MGWSTVLSPAKLNLFLEVTKRRDDGFHDLDTVMIKTTLCDRIGFRVRNDDRICMAVRHWEGEGQAIPVGPSNQVWRAVDLLRNKTGRLFGLDIVLDKRIPSRAGLGGGSSNAASTLLFLNRLLELELPSSELMALANQLGSDQAFFFARTAARCEGRGDRVTPLPTLPRLWFLIVMPPAGLDTGSVFRDLPVSTTPKSSQELCHDWRSLDARGVARHLFNRLEATSLARSPAMRPVLKALRLSRAAGAQMSGSGSACFGVYATHSQASRDRSLFRSRMPHCRTYLAAAAALLPHRALRTSPVLQES